MFIVRHDRSSKRLELEDGDEFEVVLSRCSDPRVAKEFGVGAIWKIKQNKAVYEPTGCKLYGSMSLSSIVCKRDTAPLNINDYL